MLDLGVQGPFRLLRFYLQDQEKSRSSREGGGTHSPAGLACACPLPPALQALSGLLPLGP